MTNNNRISSRNTGIGRKARLSKYAKGSTDRISERYTRKDIFTIVGVDGCFEILEAQDGTQIRAYRHEYNLINE